MGRLILPLKRPSPFSFPGGNPGFDPSHPLAKNIRFSGVARGANFVNLLNGKPGVITGAPTSVINGSIGPATNVGAGGASDRLTFSGSVGSNNAFTIAAITIGNSVGSNAAIFSTAATGVGAGFTFYQQGGGVLWVQTWGVTPARAMGSNLVEGRPYFICVTGDATLTTNFVWTDLVTGATQSFSVGAAAAPCGTSAGNYAVGNWPSGFDSPAVYPIAAVMYSDVLTPKPTLLAVAQDPWSFWYPCTLDLKMMLNAPGIAPSLVPYSPWPQAAPILAQ